MDEFLSGLGKTAAIILIVIFVFPALISMLLIDYVGNFTDSAAVYIAIHVIIAIILMAIGFAPGGLWWSLIVGGTGIFFLLVSGIMIWESMSGEFDYDRYEDFDNWNVPIERTE